MKGIVVRLLGKVCTVRPRGERQQPYECFLRGRLFEKQGAQIAIGDEVEFDPVEEFHSLLSIGGEGSGDHFTGVIHEVLPRRRALTRPPGSCK